MDGAISLKENKPVEIPVPTTPDETYPNKNPDLSPKKDNPINPKTDEPSPTKGE